MIEEKIKKLQALYNHPNTEPNLAKAARRKEKELRKKYKVIKSNDKKSSNIYELFDVLNEHQKKYGI